MTNRMKDDERKRHMEDDGCQIGIHTPKLAKRFETNMVVKCQMWDHRHPSYRMQHDE